MIIEVRRNLVSANKYAVKCPNAMNAKYITVHNTANDASADGEVRYMVGNSNKVSYHYAIDDKEVVQGVPENRNAWHCGDGSDTNSGNRTSIGVEICYSKSGGERYEKAEALAVKFIAQLLKERGWSVDRVKKHQDWSGKYCPHRILADGRWDEFKAEVARELAFLNETKTVAAPKAEVKSVEIVAKSASIVPYPGKLIRKGSRGKDVERVQRAVGVKADSIYGPATESAVKAYQKRKGLAADGIVGRKSWEVMF